MQQSLAYIFQTLFQHEVFVINANTERSLALSRYVSHGNTIIGIHLNFLYKPAKKIRTGRL
jgi:hypothetical protein